MENLPSFPSNGEFVNSFKVLLNFLGKQEQKLLKPSIQVKQLS